MEKEGITWQRRQRQHPRMDDNAAIITGVASILLGCIMLASKFKRLQGQIEHCREGAESQTIHR